MKKWLLAIIGLTTATVSAQAYDYGYLTIETADGTTTSLAVEQLKLTFADGQLVATNGDGSQTFTLAQLAKMYFSTNGTNGISQTVSDDTQSVEVFTVGGLSLGTFDTLSAAKSTLGTGLYIIKKDNKTIKIAVK